MNKDLPLVSVIIPVYNGQEHIGSCLQSVLEQTYENLEIIVVNDGSTDKSLSVIESFQQIDKRILYVNKVNEGLPLARKTGVDIATGKYIQHLDSDDTLIKDAIEHLVRVAEEKQADIVAAPFFFCTQGEKPKLSVKLQFDELSGFEYFREILNQRAYWSVWSNFQRRSLFLNNPIETVPNISFGEDAILMTQLCFFAKKVASIYEPILNYNRYPTSMSYQINDSKYDEFRAYQVWIENFLKEKELYQSLAEEMAAMHLGTTTVSMSWRKLSHIKQDMKRVITTLKLFPELQKRLSKQELKVISYYKLSPLAGYIKLKYYYKKKKL